MKAKIEIEIPEGLCGEHEESDVIAQKIQALLNTAELPIELSSVIEISADPVWQVWFKGKDGDEWIVSDSTSFGVPGSAVQGDETYKILQELTCYTAKDALVYLERQSSYGSTSPVIRHEKDRNFDPIPVEIYLPSFGPACLDLTSFLYNDDGDKIEEMAARGWELNSSDLGAAFLTTALKPSRPHPLTREVFEDVSLIDQGDEFTAEIFHDRSSFEQYLLTTKGHDPAAYIEREALEAWLRQNRSELHYPESTVTP